MTRYHSFSNLLNKFIFNYIQNYIPFYIIIQTIYERY